MKNKTEELGKTINAILLAGDMMLNPPDDLAEFIDKLAIIKSRLDQILQACNQWLEENRAEHQVIRRATRFDDEHFVYEPLRLEIDA